MKKRLVFLKIHEICRLKRYFYFAKKANNAVIYILHSYDPCNYEKRMYTIYKI